MSEPIQWSEFGDAAAVVVKPMSGAWTDLVAHIGKANGFHQKTACPWIKMARFGDARTDSNCLRHDANVIEITGVEGDYDDEVMQPEEALERLERHHIKAVVYTSPSHTPEKPRWRVLAPLSKPAAPDQRTALLARVNGALGGVLSGESWTLSQSSYYGKVNGTEYKVLTTFDDPDDGVYIDELDDLDQIAIGKPNGRASTFVVSDPEASALARLEAGESLHEVMMHLIATWAAHGMGRAAIEAAALGLLELARPARGARVDELAGDELRRLIDGAIGKFAPPGAEQRREQQRKKAQEIGDGDGAPGPLPEIMTLEDMVANLVFISDGARVAHRDRPHISLPLAEFKLQTRASETKVGKRMVPAADLWVAHEMRVTTHTVTYRPGHGVFTTDPEGAPALNLWRERRRPSSSASVMPFLDHVAYLVPSEAERRRFLDWLAHAEQRPGVLPHTHYLMVAQQTGIGRNWLASLLARVWPGETRLGFDLVGAMLSGFNGPLSRRRLVIVDELKAADTGYGAVNHAQQLKAMLTTEHRTINPKFGRQHIEFNCARWLMLSQHYDALPLERTDRRVIVIANPSERRSPGYYAGIYALLDDDEFVQAVGGWLAARDISTYNPSEPAPLTTSKSRAVEACISDLERALIGLRDGTDAMVMTSGRIVEYLAACGVRAISGRAISAAYAAVGLVPCRSLVTLYGRRHRVVALRDTERLQAASAKELANLLEAQDAEDRRGD